MDADLSIDIDRLQRRLAELAAIGAIEGTEGCARLALTDEDKAGRDLVVTWMRDLGLEVTIDGIGNIIAVMPGEGAPVMCGSHIDTVRTGGRYDGNLGVLAGLEVIETIQTAGITPGRPLAVGVFTDEEGARFAPDMLGSWSMSAGCRLKRRSTSRASTEPSSVTSSNASAMTAPPRFPGWCHTPSWSYT